MSRMESILHPIFCLFLYFKLVATFDGNFSKRVGHFLPFAKLSSVPVFLSFLLVFFLGGDLLQGINCMSSMMVGFTSHLKNNFEFSGFCCESQEIPKSISEHHNDARSL